ncbi:hypothetical protein JL720_3429 [Aureococcus anophagefferens]|nr:hypothetical protein JL720_3429 [Aureococcus anophagefferens]
MLAALGGDDGAAAADDDAAHKAAASPKKAARPNARGKQQLSQEDVVALAYKKEAEAARGREPKGHELFKIFDRNGKGFELAELHRMIRRDLRLKPADIADDEIAKLVKTLDVDGTGCIDVAALGEYADGKARAWATERAADAPGELLGAANDVLAWGGQFPSLGSPRWDRLSPPQGLVPGGAQRSRQAGSASMRSSRSRSATSKAPSKSSWTTSSGTAKGGPSLPPSKGGCSATRSTQPRTKSASVAA